jgi:hypothetical protein
LFALWWEASIGAQPMRPAIRTNAICNEKSEPPRDRGVSRFDPELHVCRLG